MSSVGLQSLDINMRETHPNQGIEAIQLIHSVLRFIGNKSVQINGAMFHNTRPQSLFHALRGNVSVVLKTICLSDIKDIWGYSELPG
jgi:hypothetical protein